MSKEHKLRIGCFTYKVFFQPHDGDDHGSTNTDDKLIFIDSNRSQQCKRETLFHEVHHACFESCVSFKMVYESAEDREEDIIRYLSPRMMQVFQDNKWFREFIFGV